jgi:hypothetical protein
MISLNDTITPTPRRAPRRAPKLQPVIQPLAYTMEQAAIVCGRNVKQLYRDIAAGLLSTYKHGRCRMVLAEEMKQYIVRVSQIGSR